MVKYFTINRKNIHPHNSVAKSLTMGVFVPNNSRIFSTNYISLHNKSISIFKFSKSLIIGLISLALGAVSVSGATITTSGNGNWNSTINNAPWPGGTIPASTDIVIIASGNNLSTNGNRTCAGITITGTLTMASGNILTVNGDVSGSGTWTTTSSGSARTISLTGNWSFNGTSTGSEATATFTGSTDQSLTGKISTVGTLINNKTGGALNLNNTLTVTTFTNTSGIFDPGTNVLTAGTRNFTAGTLRVGATTWAGNYSGTITEPAAGTIEYDALGNQTVNALNYPGNLTLSGSGTKTVANGTSVTNNLSISGTTTASINSGVTVIIGNLTLGGLNTDNGTWGSTSSIAAFKNNTYFSATTGMVNSGNDTRSLTPTFSGLTTSQSICFGTATVTLSGTVSATGPVYPANGETVNVTINSNPQPATISGGTGAFSINFPASSIPASGNPYTITYSYSGNGFLKAPANNTSTALTVNATTSIVSQSTATQTQCMGASFTPITVTATGVGLTYQWYSNTTASTSGGTLLGVANGAQTNSYTPQSSVAGTLYYYCIVTGTCSSATSAASGAFNVNPATLIIGQSTGTQTRCIGNAFTAITVTATGTGTLSYQWYSNTVSSTSGGTSLGATNGAQTNSYTPQSSVAGTLYYYCIATGTCSSATSAASGAFIVNPTTSIVSQSTTTQTQCIGASFTPITVTTTGVGLTYQWYSNTTASTSGGTLLGAANGAQTNSYTPQSSVAGTLYYYCIVTGTCSSATSAISGAFNVNAIPASPTTTGAFICIGTPNGTILSASGAVSGQRYVWYSVATGGTALKTSSDNNDNTYTTPVLGSTTNYWITIINAGGCESPRTPVTATYPSVCTDAQTPGVDSWIGYVYGGQSSNFANNIYYGQYPEPESFNEAFGNGGDNYCFPITSNSNTISINTQNFSVRYLMNSTRKGLYTVDLGSDDGNRLTVDGTLIYTDWVNHATSSHPSVLMSLKGTSSLMYEYYENGGGNVVYFQNLTQLLANNLTSNTVQSIFVGNTGTAISGDVYGSLPTNITLSGTGYQWTYSTTPGGARTNISGATAATYSPNTLTAPFSTPGTYYLYRNAILSSANNVSPNPYVATNESNAAVLTIIAMPVITTSTAALSGFSYPVGFGPSSQLKYFTVSGVNLTTNISILPTDSFEISLSSGASFAPQSMISLLVNNGTVALDTIYVRMKAGFNIGNIAPINPITCISDNAITKNIVCSGTVTILPVISVAPASMIGFIYNAGSGPSTSQSFTVSGVNLSANLVITPPTDYEISTSSGGTYQSTPLTYTPSGGTVTSKTIYVRLMTGLSGGAYNENIVASTATSTTTVTQSIALSGSVNQPSVNVSILNLGAFIYTAGTGTTSGEQSFTVNGQYLTANLIVTAPANFEISLISGGTFGSTISLTPTSGSVVTTIIYVRMKSGIAAGTTIPPINLTVTSSGAIQQNVALSGIVVSSATSISSNAALTGFVYPYTYGPSVVQSFNVSGTSLGANNITVTAPANFEISKDASSWSTSFTIAPIGGLVNSVPVYVRLKALLNVGTYSGAPITLTSSVATTVNITCTGVVITAPTVTAGPSNLGSTCNNATVSFTASGIGVTGYTWNGPNNYYSTSQNPVLSNVTTANNGTYTVSGSALSGVNLLTNGDFSSGNSGFGSSYTYWATGTQNEGVYFVVANPNSMHSGFCACGDHTTGSGNQMVINGATSIGTIAWSESVSVVPGANYQFSYWIQTVSTAGSPGQLQLYVNGSPTGSVYTATTNENGWSQYIGNINSGSGNVLQLTLINNNTQAGGNDFALDDIVFQQAFTVSSSVTLTVNPTLPVSVGITASISPLYSGGSVTFTAAPVNGGTTPTYQWKVNGINVGTNSINFTYTPAANDQITCILTSNYPCPSGNPATSNTLTVTARSYFWVGTNSTDWGTPSNWSGGFIPAPGNDVEYASTLNAYGSNAIRDLQLDQNRTIGSLVNATSKRLVIPAGLGLIVNNTISTNNADSLIYIKSSTTGANGSLIFHNASGSPVHATVEMYSKAFYNPAGATNQKYHWQYFGIPLASVTASPLFDGSYVRIWDETGDTITNHWVSLSNSSVLLPFLGYEITQLNATTITFHGQLVNSDFASGQLTYTPTALFPGQHVYANPYTAAIDIRQLTFGPQTEATAYLYNTGTFDQWTQIGGANTPGNSAGQYVSVPKNTAGNSGLPRQVPSMGALLVKAMSNSTDATFGITYNTSVMTNTDPLRTPGIKNQINTNGVSTMIDVTGTNYSDRMWLFTQPGCTPKFDNGWDGAKIPGIALTPQIFAIEPDGNYQVDAVDDINNTILGFQAGQDVEYTLTFTHQNLSSNYANVYLVDLVENKTVDITESGSTYSFVAESTPTYVKRFMIATRTIEKDAPDKDTQLKVFTSGNTIFVQNLGSLNGEMIIYDMMGHNLKKVNFGPYGITAVPVGGIPGAYVAKAYTSNEKVNKRIILGK